MISQKTRYALKALMLLASDERKGKGPILISNLAKRGHMPQKFLEAILLELKNHGILQSKKGKGGGYTLGKPADEIMFGNIIRIMEGPLALIPCVSKSLHHRCPDCNDEETAGMRILFKEVRDATTSILDNTSLEKVLRVQDEARENKPLMYFI